jgi:hypothetical protein
MGALAGLRDVQRQVSATLRTIDPNSTDPLANKARRDARMMQAEANQAATKIAGAIRRASLDVEA